MGASIAGVFESALQPVSACLQGAVFLQLGACGDNPWLSGLRFRHRWIVSPDREGCCVSVNAYMHQLPFDNHSVDCLLAPLTLEAFVSGRVLLDEIDRVIAPEGHVLFLGINPISLWGSWLKWSKHNPFGAGHGHPKSSLYLKMALMRCGYASVCLHTFYHIPPITDAHWIKRLEVLNQIGKMVSPLPPGFYCLVMQKKEQSWRQRVKPAVYFSPRTVYTLPLIE